MDINVTVVLGQQGQVNYGFSLLMKCLRLGIPFDVVIFTTLINGLIHNDRWDQAVDLLDKIVEQSFYSTIVIYDAQVKGLCKTGDTIGDFCNIKSSIHKPNISYIAPSLIVSTRTSYCPNPLNSSWRWREMTSHSMSSLITTLFMECVIWNNWKMLCYCCLEWMTESNVVFIGETNRI